MKTFLSKNKLMWIAAAPIANVFDQKKFKQYEFIRKKK